MRLGDPLPSVMGSPHVWVVPLMWSLSLLSKVIFKAKKKSLYKSEFSVGSCFSDSCPDDPRTTKSLNSVA